MRYTFCPECGSKLIPREIGDEGYVPYCEACSRPWFDQVYTCTIAVAVNEFGEAALIRQGYVSEQHYVLVAGYVKPGETAEQTAAREVTEELGIAPLQVQYLNSYFYEKKGMLMLGFLANVKKADFQISGEVDSAKWVPMQEVQNYLRKGSVASQVCEAAEKVMNKWEKKE